VLEFLLIGEFTLFFLQLVTLKDLAISVRFEPAAALALAA
jgi:hypothetical protein